MRKTKQLQNRIDKISFLAGFRAEWRNHSYWLLTAPGRDNIYLQNSQVADLWLTFVEKFGRDNAALRRMR